MQAPESRREARPWGEFVEFARNTPCTVKILAVKAGESLSLQYHHGRDEMWHVLSGAGTLQIGDERIDAVPGSDHFIPRETKHRITAGASDLAILEISTGTFDDADIVRVEDRYGRS